MDTPSVLVVGSFNQDLTWVTPSFPLRGETVTGQFTTGPGGKGSNQAVASARTGQPTIFVGACGDDTFGRALPDFYSGEGIQHHLAVKAAQPTGNAGIWVDHQGHNSIIVALGANLALEVADVPEEAWRAAGVLVCQQEISLETNRALLKEARKRGITTLLNPAPMVDHFDPGILPLVDVLLPNESELLALLKTFDLDAGPDVEGNDLAAVPDAVLHRLCRQFGVRWVVVTLGGAGCFVSSPDGYERIPALKVDQVVDTTGAGDGFVGGFAAGWVRYGGDPLRAARYGTVVGGLSVTQPGTAPSMPGAKAVASRLGEVGL